jgi:hypothetical protein
MKISKFDIVLRNDDRINYNPITFLKKLGGKNKDRLRGDAYYGLYYIDKSTNVITFSDNESDFQSEIIMNASQYFYLKDRLKFNFKIKLRFFIIKIISKIKFK